jgi:Zn-dependent peptidase ImmA (M78 family)/transcriptional regulator with XRE-family HTH domain
VSVINLNRLVLARESRALNQTELNEKAGLPITTLNKVERGELGLSPDALTRIAHITGYPVSFFSADGDPAPDTLSWRRREKVKQKEFAAVSARINIVRLHLQTLIRDLGIKSMPFPFVTLTETYRPVDAARHLRKAWDIPEAPILNLTATLESKGLPIAAFAFDTERVDSRSTTTDDGYPLICVNSRHTADRQRFSIAYQLGHLVMHTYTNVSDDQDTSHEANEFAAEFLVPEAAIRPDLEGREVTSSLLADLKLKWRVSMISLLYRSFILGYLTDNQKRYLIQKFNKEGIRRREPVRLDVPIEHPQLIRTWLASIRRKEKLDTAGLAARMHMTTEEFISMYG